MAVDDLKAFVARLNPEAPWPDELAYLDIVLLARYVNTDTHCTGLFIAASDGTDAIVQMGMMQVAARVTGDGFVDDD